MVTALDGLLARLDDIGLDPGTEPERNEGLLFPTRSVFWNNPAEAPPSAAPRAATRPAAPYRGPRHRTAAGRPGEWSRRRYLLARAWRHDGDGSRGSIHGDLGAVRDPGGGVLHRNDAGDT